MLNKIKLNESYLSKLSTLISQDDDAFFPFQSAINVLEINNEVIKSVLGEDDEELNKMDCLKRMYCVLQTLFSSVDSLYSLNMLITKNKNFINLNQNRHLRELKHIKNHVVNHDFSNSKEERLLGTCYIKKDLVTPTSFKYYIMYYNKDMKAREVKIFDIIEDFYDEANILLNHIITFNPNPNTQVISQIKKIYKRINSSLDIQDDVLELRSMYLRENPNHSNKDVRIVWRMEQLMKMVKLYTNDKEVSEIYDYISGHLVTRIYDLSLINSSTESKDFIVNNMKVPKGVIQYQKLVEKVEEAKICTKYLSDMTNPLFYPALSRVIEYSIKYDFPNAQKYLELIKQAYTQNDMDLVYCLGCVL